MWFKTEICFRRDVHWYLYHSHAIVVEKWIRLLSKNAFEIRNDAGYRVDNLATEDKLENHIMWLLVLIYNDISLYMYKSHHTF